MRLSYGHHALQCARQRQAHLAHCAPCLLAPERLQQLSLISGASNLLGWMVVWGFRGLYWQWLQIRATVWYWDVWRPYLF